MSKQLTLSATIAVLATVLFAVVVGTMDFETAAARGSDAPLIGLTVSR